MGCAVVLTIIGCCVMMRQTASLECCSFVAPRIPSPIAHSSLNAIHESTHSNIPLFPVRLTSLFANLFESSGNYHCSLPVLLSTTYMKIILIFHKFSLYYHLSHVSSTPPYLAAYFNAFKEFELRLISRGKWVSFIKWEYFLPQMRISLLLGRSANFLDDLCKSH